MSVVSQIFEFLSVVSYLFIYFLFIYLFIYLFICQLSVNPIQTLKEKFLVLFI